MSHVLGDASSMMCSPDKTGTFAFMAPEVFTGSVSCQSDIYSFGCVLYCMSAGQHHLYADLHPWQVCVGVQDGSLQLQWPVDTHPLLRKLGEACLSHDRALRPSFNTVTQVGAGSPP